MLFHDNVLPESSDDAVCDVTSPGTVGDSTVAVFEKAAVEPPAFVAVTRQRIGLA